MGTVPENRRHWGDLYDWKHGGEEWSDAWGGSHAQWSHTLLPRLSRFLPASRAVEIGCGHGRWTNFLRDHCRELIALDLADSCVAACADRFAADSRVVCRQTDGASLTGVADGSVDLVFSFDSLVHAEFDTLEGYLGEVRRCLAPDGVAFLHHSNFGEILALRPGSWNHHWRAESVSAERIAGRCAELGLIVRSQEIIAWGEVVDCDSLSVIVLPRGRWAGPSVVVRNPWFMGEAYSIGLRTRLYGLDQPTEGSEPAGRRESKESGADGGHLGTDSASSPAESARKEPRRGENRS